MSEPETVGEARKVEVAAVWLYGFHHDLAGGERLGPWSAMPEERRECFRDAARDLFDCIERLPEISPRLASQPAPPVHLNAKEKGRTH